MSMECQVNVKSQSELDIGGRETCFPIFFIFFKRVVNHSGMQKYFFQPLPPSQGTFPTFFLNLPLWKISLLNFYVSLADFNFKNLPRNLLSFIYFCSNICILFQIIYLIFIAKLENNISVSQFCENLAALAADTLLNYL